MPRRALHSFKKIFTSIMNFFGILSGAIVWVFSMAILLFALTANAQTFVPGSEPLKDDDYTKFVENLTSTANVRMMDAQGLTRGAASFEPWSGSYWPIHKGVLGVRYASKTFANSKNFMTNYNSYMSEPTEAYISAGRINQLSPAEKYDLLIGDYSWSLTKFMWQKGLTDYQRDGGVAGWTGICHGWSGVTHVGTPSPYYPVTVRDVNSRYEITFQPNDIKGLLSWLWAQSAPTSYRAGDRCRQGSVQKDPYLRPLDPACLDSNPMTWHLAIVNRVGLNKKSFVMDSSNGPQVWNYPITGYDYSYFDPKTFVPTHSLNEAIRSVAELPNDIYRGYRSPKTKYIVGVSMDTYHPALTEPTVGITSRITTKRITFVYDLELDESMNIVGGEWYAKDTPDFLWSFPEGNQAMAREDGILRSHGISWSPKSEAIPEEMATSARNASRRGDVLASISYSLLKASAKTSDDVTPPTDNVDGTADENEIGSDSNNNSQPNPNEGDGSHPLP